MEGPKVEIGLREIYDAVLELKTIVSSHPDKLDDHETRIRKLEFKVWSAAGFSGIIAVVISQIIGAISL